MKEEFPKDKLFILKSEFGVGSEDEPFYVTFSTK